MTASRAKVARQERALVEIAPLRRDAAESGTPGGQSKRCQRSGVVLDGMDGPPRRQRQREGADPGVEIGNALSRADRLRDGGHERRLAGARRLPETAHREIDANAAGQQRLWPATFGDRRGRAVLSPPPQPREILVRGKAGERLKLREPGLGWQNETGVDAGRRRLDDATRGTARFQDPGGEAAQRLDEQDDFGDENRTFSDIDDAMR